MRCTVLCLVGAALATIGAVAPTAPATAQAVVGVRYVGYVTIGPGNVPAPEKTLIRVLAPRAGGGFRVCARGRVRGANGSYEIEVPVESPCIADTIDQAPVLHVFAIDGENTGFESCAASRDNPGSLGKRRRQDLKITDVPSFFSSSVPPGTKLVGVRYYGTLTLGRRPARPDTDVQVVVTTAGGGQIVCGTGTTAGADGAYYVDVPMSRCIASTHDDAPTQHFFVVAGEEIAIAFDPASLDLPRSLGKVRRVDLSGPRRLRR